MIAHVWHVKRELYGSKATFPCDYGCVARVVVEGLQESLETAFRLTNHIDSDWTKNDGVQVLACEPLRSTSVGDVVELDNGFWEARSVGWQKLML